MATASAPAPAPEAVFRDDCRALAAAANRLPGSPEVEAAAQYVAARLTAAGAEAVVTQTFPTVLLHRDRSELVLGDRRLPLEPLRPNGIIAPVTPDEGIRGRLLPAGHGTPTDYGTNSPAGRIVVLDYNSGDAWLRAFRYGAKAVIFVRTEPLSSAHALYTEANANLPRYYYPGPAADLTADTEAVIHCDMTWQPATGRNVIGFFQGTAPTLQLGMEEAVVVAASLDAFGEVPFLAPGARSAANAAALLQLADALRRERPRRHVVLLFVDAQALGHAGTSAFYRALDHEFPAYRLPKRREAWQGEAEFLFAALRQLERPRSLANPVEGNVRVLRLLKAKADESAFEQTAVLEEIRRSLHVQRKSRGTAVDDRQEARLAELEADLRLRQTAKEKWNGLRRILARGELDRATRPPHDACFGEAVNRVKRDLRDRLMELSQAKRDLDSDQQLFERLGKSWVALHISFRLGDGSPRWGIQLGGDSFLHLVGDDPGLYGKVQRTVREVAKTTPLPHFETGTVDGTVNARRFAAGPLIHSGEVAGRLGIYNLVFGTLQDRLPREGTPDDTLDALNLEPLIPQIAEAVTLVGKVADSDALSLRRAVVADRNYVLPVWQSGGDVAGPTVMGVTPGSSLPNKPMPGTVIQLRQQFLYESRAAFRPDKIPGFCNYQVMVTDANAAYGYGPLMRDTGHVNLCAFAARFTERGEADAVSDSAGQRQVDTRLNLFSCRIRNYVADRGRFSQRWGAAVLPPLALPAEAQVLQAFANGALDLDRANAGTLDGVVYWYCDRQVEAVKLFGPLAMVALDNGGIGSRFTGAEAERDPYGSGFSLLRAWEFPDTAPRSAADLWRLNEHRLRILRQRGILNSAIEDLHARSEDLLRAAGNAPDFATRQALSASANLAERPVYKEVRNRLDDLVHAVVILLVLALPFAFALERLLIGATSIYRQIAWFATFFAATFGLLRLVHPAFAVSNQPIIIFLAFALMLLSGLVIVVILRKFEHELKVIQGLTSTVHTADVSRIGTMMAAMSMGISTMRRRPLRTALTALTILLLTFTLLNFAAFDTRLGIVTLHQGAPPPYAAAFIRRTDYGVLDASAQELIACRWGCLCTAVPRVWATGGPNQGKETGGLLISRTDGSAPLALRGVLGLDPREIARRTDLQQLLGPNHAALATGAFISRTLARRLQVQPTEEIAVDGVRLPVAGLLEAAAMARVREADGVGILPLDPAQLSPGTGGQAQAETAAVDLPADGVIVVSAATARRLGGELHGINLYTDNATLAARLAEDAARTLPLPVFATRNDGVYTHVLAPIFTAHGLRDLFFPILLGGLVILGTMLGSVADREREIYTFSALGLAPTHVATLFFAEALMYAFIGGLGGYLLAQELVQGLGLLAAAGLPWSVPEMNYSSTNAIVTILLVMATVLISATYPALKASRSANPGILRNWRLPAPTGDRLEVLFPFTVSQYDSTGVISFLKEHFDNFSDTGLGVFMARHATIGRHHGGLGLRAKLALAPFDLGVTQSFLLYSVPSDVPGINQVRIDLGRLSGQQEDWLRLNKVLLDNLRRQFLLWRALPPETMEIYRRRTLALRAAREPVGESIGA